MKKLTLTLLTVIIGVAASAQFQRLEVKEIPNDGSVPGKTYRIYAVMAAPNDVIDAVFADENNPLEIVSTKPFYQHAKGGFLAVDVQRFDVQNDAKLKYDSWFTIGSEDNYNNYLMPFLMDEGEVAEFESGGKFSTTSSAWFVTPDRRQAFADQEGKILLMQLTTEGTVNGKLNIHGRTRAVLDGEGNIISGGEIIEERNLTFTCGK